LSQTSFSPSTSSWPRVLFAYFLWPLVKSSPFCRAQLEDSQYTVPLLALISLWIGFPLRHPFRTSWLSCLHLDMWLSRPVTPCHPAVSLCQHPESSLLLIPLWISGVPGSSSSSWFIYALLWVEHILQWLPEDIRTGDNTRSWSPQKQCLKDAEGLGAGDSRL
jgi:hypothetical protein